MKRTLLLAAAALLSGGGCTRTIQMAADPEYLTPNGPSLSPYSPVVLVGNLVFLSGQVGVDAQGKLQPGGIQAEERQALNNIRDLLKRSGSSLDRIAKCTVFLTDMNEYAAMNEIYASYFTNHKPARTTVGVTALPFGARIEIECVAVLG